MTSRSWRALARTSTIKSMTHGRGRPDEAGLRAHRDLPRLSADHARRDDRERRARADRRRPRGLASRRNGSSTATRSRSRRCCCRPGRWPTASVRAPGSARPGIFGVGSAACAGSRLVTALIVARVIQGAGAACADAVLAGPDRARLPGGPRAPPSARPLGRRVGDRPGRRPGARGCPDRVPRLARDLPGQRADRRSLPPLLLVRHVDETHRHGHPLDIPGQTARDRRPGLTDRRVHRRGRQGWGERLTARPCWSPGARRRRVRGRRTNGPPTRWSIRSCSASRRSRPRSRSGRCSTSACTERIFCLAIDLHRARGSIRCTRGWRCCP